MPAFSLLLRVCLAVLVLPPFAHRPFVQGSFTGEDQDPPGSAGPYLGFPAELADYILNFAGDETQLQAGLLNRDMCRLTQPHRTRLVARKQEAVAKAEKGLADWLAAGRLDENEFLAKLRAVRAEFPRGVTRVAPTITAETLPNLSKVLTWINNKQLGYPGELDVLALPANAVMAVYLAQSRDTRRYSFKNYDTPKYADRWFRTLPAPDAPNTDFTLQGRITADDVVKRVEDLKRWPFWWRFHDAEPAALQRYLEMLEGWLPHETGAVQVEMRKAKKLLAAFLWLINTCKAAPVKSMGRKRPAAE